MITNRFLKKGLAVLLSLTIVLSMMPAAVFADDGSDSSEPVNGQETVVAPDENQDDTQQDSQDVKQDEPEADSDSAVTTASDEPELDPPVAGMWLNISTSFPDADESSRDNYVKTVSLVDGPDAVGTITPFLPANYFGTITYKSSDPDVVSVNSSGKTTVTGVGTAKITISGTSYTAADKSVYYAEDSVSYTVVVKGAVADFDANPTAAAKLLAANGGSAIWDADSKTLTIKDINYAATIIDGDDTSRNAVIMPANSTIVLSGKNTIGFTSGETKGLAGVKFYGDGTIKGGSDNPSEGSLNISGSMCSGISGLPGAITISGATVNLDIKGTDTSAYGAIDAKGTITITGSSKVTVNYSSAGGTTAGILYSGSGNTNGIKITGGADVTVKAKGTYGIKAASTDYAAVNITEGDTNVNVEADKDAISTGSGTFHISYTYTTLVSNNGYAINTSSIDIDAVQSLVARGAQGAFYYTNSISVNTSNKSCSFSENFDGTNPSAKYDKTKAKAYKYAKISANKVSWLRFTEKTKVALYCDYANGEYGIVKPAYPVEYAGTITYESSNPDIATVDPNTGKVTINNEGKLGKTTIKATGTADSSIYAKEMSDSYDLIVTGMADFTANPTRACQLLTANGGTATWNESSKMLTIKDINYKADPINEDNEFSVAVYLPAGTNVNLEGSNTIRFADGEKYAAAAIACEGNLIFGPGRGTLDISGDMVYGIEAEGDLTLVNGSFTVKINKTDFIAEMLEDDNSAALYANGGVYLNSSSNVEIAYTADKGNGIYAAKDLEAESKNLTVNATLGEGAAMRALGNVTHTGSSTDIKISSVNNSVVYGIDADGDNIQTTGVISIKGTTADDAAVCGINGSSSTKFTHIRGSLRIELTKAGTKGYAQGGILTNTAEIKNGNVVIKCEDGYPIDRDITIAESLTARVSKNFDGSGREAYNAETYKAAAEQYKYFSAGTLEANTITFENKDVNRDYSAEATFTKAATATNTDSPIVYTVTQGADIASVDQNGTVTINSDGKCGTVTIKAEQDETESYEAASASYSFSVSAQADFKLVPERALQLINKNATAGSASWDAESNTLTIEGLNYSADSSGSTAIMAGDATLVVKGTNTVKSNKITALQGFSTIKGATADAKLTVSGPSNAIRFGGGVQKLTIQDLTLIGSAQNDSILNSYVSGSTAEIKNSDVTLNGGAALVNSNISAINFDSSYIEAEASTNADGSGAAAYDNSKRSTYKYFKAVRMASDWLTFEETTKTVQYYEGTVNVPVSMGDYDGTVTYKSSDTDLATVDGNGVVTINDKAKTGSVVITAEAPKTEHYKAATASYELKITGDRAAFSTTAKSKRSAQLLAAKSGSAEIVFGADEKTLKIKNVNYEGDVLLGPGYRAITFEGTNTLGSAEKQLYVAEGLKIEGNGKLNIDSPISCSGPLSFDSQGDVIVRGAVVDRPSSINVNSGKVTFYDLDALTLANKDIRISGGTFILTTGNAYRLIDGNTLTIADGMWAEAGNNPDGSDAKAIIIKNNTITKDQVDEASWYLKVSDEKLSDWLSFEKGNLTADYCANEVPAATLNIPDEYVNRYGGKVTYASSAPEIAAVDENTGAVTLNNNGKTGTVTITATASAGTGKYEAATASYDLTVTGIADFTADGEKAVRAAQLLAANSGTAEWSADENKLTLDGITYESGDNNDVVILPENATVTLNENNVIKGSKCANIVTFKGSGTVNGTGTLTVTGTSEADNAVFIGGDKLTIDKKATVNTDGVGYGFAGKSGAILHVNTGCAYAKGSSRAISANVELTTADRVNITAAETLDGTLGEYDASQMAKYKQIRAKYVAANEITFEKTQGNVEYCATSSVTNKASGLGTGKITYEVTEGADIVDVDANGKVTIDKGRFGKVTITATQEADDDYEAASASYSFNVRGKADFDANQARALKLLNTSGGGGTAKIVSGELVLENIDYAVDYGVAVKFDGNIVAKGTNSITTRGINNKINDNNEVALYLGGNKTIKGDGTLNLTSENSRALFVWGDCVTFAGGVTVNAKGNMYTIYEQYTGRINIDNANLIVSSKTNDGQGGWVRSSSIQRGLNYDPNKIKAVVGGYGEMNPNQLEPVSGETTYVHARRYFSATVKKTITAPNAYTLSTTEKPLDAAGVTVSSADINALDTSYDGDLKNATFQYKNAAGDMLDKITAAGTYGVWLSMPTTTEYQPIAAASIGTLTVTKGTVNAAELFNGGDQTKVYDGDVKKYDFPTDIGCYDGELNVVYTDKDGNTLTSVRSVGKYDVYVSAKATDNFEAFESTKVGTLTITGKEVPAGDIFGEFSKTVTYDGEAKTVTADELTKNDEAYNGTVAISYKQGEEAVEAPTDAGTYDVYISADAVGNYAAITETKIGTLTIDKKQLDSAKDAFTFAGEGNKQTVKYDGEIRKAEIEKKNIVGYEDGVAKITYKQGDDVVENPTAVGTYTVYVSADESKNYKAIPETEMGTLEIVKGDSTLAFAKERISNVYYCLNNVETNPLVSNSTGKITYAVTTGSEIADVDAETGKVTIDNGRFGDVVITATQEADGNYEAATASYNFTVIGQADFECNPERALKLLRTNGGENCNAEWDASTKTLTIENLTYETNGASAILAKASDKATLVVKGENVIKTAGAVALNLFSTVRGEGDGAKLTLEGNDGIRVNDSHKLSIQDITLIAKGNVNGVYAYNDASVEIKNANVTISGAENALIGKNSTSVTLKYDSSTIKAVASANTDGSGLADYDSSKSSTYKYVKATVKNAAPTKDVFSVSENTATYDGTAHTAKVTIADASKYDGNIKNATVEYQAKDGSKSNAATNAGEYAILLSIPATDNYQPVKELNVGTLTINKATATADKAFTYEDETVAYTGNPVSATKIGRTDLVGFDYSKMTVTYKQGESVVAAPTDKGTYDVYVGAEASENYNAVEPKKLGTLTIAASDVAATNIFNEVNVTATYDGNEHTATLTLKDTAYTGLAEAELSYTDSKGGTVTAPKNAGTYTVYVEAPESGKYAAIIKTEIGTVTISKAAAVAADIFGKVEINVPYDGAAHEANLARNNPLYDGNNNWTVSYYKVENGKETLIDGAPVNAGTYNVHVSAGATVNFEAMADAAIGTVTITAKEITFSIEDGTDKATYDGDKHLVTVKASAENYDGKLTVTYKQGKAVIAEPTNAGTYDVYVSAEATDNFTEVTETKIGELVIAKATATVEDAFTYENQTFTYDGNAKTANVTSNKLIKDFTLAPVITYKKNGETVTEVKDAGEYEVWVGAVETDNYNAVESAKIGTLTITASELSFSIEEGTDKATYDGDSHKATVKATDSKYDGKLTVTYKQGEKVIDEPTNAGTYDIYVSAEATTNFKAVTETKIGELAIDRATVTANDAFGYKDTVVAYSGKEQTANVSVKDIPGFTDGAEKMFIKYKKSGEEDFLENNPKAIGTYEVWVGAAETANYNAIDAMKLGTLEITSKTAEATKIFKPVDTNVTYTGEPQSAVLEKVEGSDYDGTPQLSYAKADGTPVESPTNVGTYKVFVTAKATETYAAIASTEIGTLTINKATLNVVDIFGGELNATAKDESGNTYLAVTAGYDGNAHKINMPTDDKYKDLPWNITYTKGEETLTEAINAGTYDIGVSATGMENYEVVENTYLGTLEITQATASDFEVAGELNPTYDGNKHEVTVTAKDSKYDGELEVVYKKNGEAADPINAGKYEIYVSADAAVNYAAIAETKVGEIAIAKATATADKAFAYEDETFGYDGEAKTANVTSKELIKGFKATPVVTYKKSGEENFLEGNPQEIGTYEVWAGAAESDNYNAIEPAKIGTLTITQATAKDFEVTGELNPIYDGNKHEVTVTATDDKYDGKLKVAYKKDGEAADPINAGTYEIWVSAEETATYEAISKKLDEKIVIAKATTTAGHAFSYEDEILTFDDATKTAAVTANELINGFKATPVITYKKDGVEVTSPKAIGVYEVWVGAAESENYNAIEPAKLGTMTIKDPAAEAFDITGTIVSWDDEAAEIKLYATGEDMPFDNIDIADDAAVNKAIRIDMRDNNGAKAIADYNGNIVEAVEEAGKCEQTFKISGVEAGTYKLAIFKAKYKGKDPYVVTVIDVTVEAGVQKDVGDIDMWLYGDVNHDGKVKLYDAVQIQRYITGLSSEINDDDNIYTEYQHIAADCNGDGKIKLYDAVQTQRYITGLSSVFDDFER